MPDEGTQSPDAEVEFMVTTVSGTWGTDRLSGPARVRLTSDAILVDASHGASLRLALAELTGGGWRTGTLTIHGAAGSVSMETTSRLDTAWAALVARSCPIPEFARSHRHLGSKRGGAIAAQSRFLAPLLQMRRELQAETDLDRRVQALSAGLLRDRLQDVLGKLAAEAHPSSAPDRRGLLAELNEAMAPLFGRIDEMEAAARGYAAATEEERFDAWREWVATVMAVYVSADLGWSAAAGLLPAGAGR
jgi:hypothetical protein